MTEEGAGGRTMARCHYCQGLASMAGDSFIHLDGTPLCKVTEHLPECWASEPTDPEAWCICDELRACEARVTAAAVQRVEAISDDPNSGVDWNWDYDIDPTGMTRNPRVWIREAVAAIKNEVK